MRGVFINRPWFWLLFQGAGLLIIFLRYETFQLIPVDVDGYWFWAKNLDWLSLTDVLSIRRTFGYPLFLRCVHLFSRSMTALPICQLVLRLLAVFVFYWGLRHLKLSSWLALFVSSSLFYPETVPFAGDQLTSRLMSDSPAQSLAIMTIGLLLIVIGRPRSALAWLGLLLSLF